MSITRELLYSTYFSATPPLLSISASISIVNRGRNRGSFKPYWRPEPLSDGGRPKCPGKGPRSPLPRKLSYLLATCMCCFYACLPGVYVTFAFVAGWVWEPRILVREPHVSSLHETLLRRIGASVRQIPVTDAGAIVGRMASNAAHTSTRDRKRMSKQAL